MIFADGHLDPGTEKCAVKPNRGRKGMQCICRRPFHPHVVIVYPMYFQSKTFSSACYPDISTAYLSKSWVSWGWTNVWNFERRVWSNNPRLKKAKLGPWWGGWLLLFLHAHFLCISAKKQMHCNILVFLFIIIMRPKTTIIFSHHDSGSYFYLEKYIKIYSASVFGIWLCCDVCFKNWLSLKITIN